MPDLRTAIQAAQHHCSKKEAAGALDAALAAASERHMPNVQQAVQSAALKDALKWIGIGGASGFALRGLQGLMEQPRRNLRQPVSGLSTPKFVDVPVGPQRGDEKQKSAGIADKLVEGIKWTGEGLVGKHVTKPDAHPLWMLGAIGGGSIAGLGGYKMHDIIIDKMRKDELKTQLDQARMEYEQALRPKQANDDSLGSDLDELYDEMCKCSSGDSAGLDDSAGVDARNLLGRIGGGYSLYALLTGALGAGASYNHFKKKQRRSLLESAQEKRRRQQFDRSPTPLFARAVPDTAAVPEKEQPFKAAPSLY